MFGLPVNGPEFTRMQTDHQSLMHKVNLDEAAIEDLKEEGRRAGVYPRMAPMKGDYDHRSARRPDLAPGCRVIRMPNPCRTRPNLTVRLRRPAGEKRPSSDQGMYSLKTFFAA